MGIAASATILPIEKTHIRNHPLYATLVSQRLQQIGNECLAQFRAGEPFVLFPLSACNVPNPDHTVYEDEPIAFSKLSAHLTSILPCAHSLSLSPQYYGTTLMTTQSYLCVAFVHRGDAHRS